MEKKVLAGASREKQKYFFEREFDALPQSVKDELKNICIVMAERLGCTFLIYFEETGDVLLIKSLKLWYVINMTEEGKKIREELLKKSENKD